MGDGDEGHLLRVARVVEVYVGRQHAAQNIADLPANEEEWLRAEPLATAVRMASKLLDVPGAVHFRSELKALEAAAER